MRMEDGEITISRDSLLEPEIHEKLRRKPSGRKVVERNKILRQVVFSDLIHLGKIQIQNASGTWRTNENGIDRDAFMILSKIFYGYQLDGEVPREVGWLQ